MHSNDIEHQCLDQATSAKKRYWILPVLFGLCFVLVVMSGLALMATWLRQQRPAAELFYERAVAEVRPGASMAEIKQLFGESKALARDDVPGSVTSMIVDPRWAKYNPDGIEPTDKFLCYSVADQDGNSEEWYLQFRGEKLVNFDAMDFPATYAESRQAIVGLSR
jgi:hypothetical protein